MIKTVATLVVAFVLALAAGASLGLLASPRGAVPGSVRPDSAGGRGDHSWLDDQLQLTPEQRDKLRAIWEETHAATHRAFDQRAAIERDADGAVYNLLTDEQKAKYKAIRDESQRRADDLDRDVRKTFDAAEARTREVLTPEQLQTFEMLRAAHGHGHGPPMGMGLRRGGPIMPPPPMDGKHGPPPFLFGPPPPDPGPAATQP